VSSLASTASSRRPGRRCGRAVEERGGVSGESAVEPKGVSVPGESGGVFPGLPDSRIGVNSQASEVSGCDPLVGMRWEDLGNYTLPEAGSAHLTGRKGDQGLRLALLPAGGTPLALGVERVAVRAGWTQRVERPGRQQVKEDDTPTGHVSGHKDNRNATRLVLAGDPAVHVAQCRLHARRGRKTLRREGRARWSPMHRNFGVHAFGSVRSAAAALHIRR
jgi:hypothetical protein